MSTLHNQASGIIRQAEDFQQIARRTQRNLVTRVWALELRNERCEGQEEVDKVGYGYAKVCISLLTNNS